MYFIAEAKASKMEFVREAGVKMIPKDPMMLLSYVNTQLRDHYGSLEELAEGLDIPAEEILNRLEPAGYVYNIEENRFCRK